MNRGRGWLLAVLGLVGVLSLSVHRAEADSGTADIEAFNQKFLAAHLRMDTAQILSFWEEGGVSLMPEMAPIVGKKAIPKFVEDAVASMPGYKVTKQEIEWHDIRVSGDWVSEWGLEHQVAEGPPGKPTFDGRGKILLILHKRGGEWKIEQEMWNSAGKQ
jgi:ketosteroid isomerase-like protein